MAFDWHLEGENNRLQVWGYFLSEGRVLSWQRHKTVQFRIQIHVPSGIRDVAEADISNQYGFQSLCERAGQLLRRPSSPSLMEKEAIEKLIPTGKLLCILF